MADGADGGAGSGLLVLGGSGFLGVHLVERALASGRFGRVVVAARRPRGAPLMPEALVSESLEFCELDLELAGALSGALAELDPAVVINAAGCTRQAQAESDPARAQRLNSGAVAELAEWCQARRRRLVHLSTDLVFEGSAGPCAEAAQPTPRGVYASTKHLGELAALGGCSHALVVRLPLLFGDSRGRGLGASDSLVAGLRAGRRTVLFTDEYRQPLEVTAAARALCELAGGAASGMVHLTGAELVSRAEFGRRALAAREAAGAEPLEEPEFGPRSVLGLERERPARLSLEGSRARGMLTGWPEPLERGLERWARTVAHSE